MPKRRSNGTRKANHSRTTSRVALGVVRGVSRIRGGKRKRRYSEIRFIWKVELGAARNYRLLGQRLAKSGDLFRNGDGHGLIQVTRSNTTRLITKGAQLAPLIVDRLPMLVQKESKVVSELPTAGHLNAMLQSEEFLSQFAPVDEVTSSSFYTANLSLVRPGYNDGGPGHRVLYFGETPPVAECTETLERFLDAMPFASNADRTNFVAAGLSVALRRLWPGEKPLVLITSTRSHSGKGTLADCFCGRVPKASILYGELDCTMQSQIQRQLLAENDIGVIVFDNVRLDSAGGRAGVIRSAFLECFLTSAEIVLAATVGEPLRLINRFVVTLNTNDGHVSNDLLDRSLPIHLAPTGDVTDRPCPIGNPKLEFLPRFGPQIEAEFRGLIERWKRAGSPLDEAVRHPMLSWAKTIGGILKFNGFTDFLGNYGSRKTAADPVREALAILGAARPGKPLRPAEWARLAVEQGLHTTLFSSMERGTEKGMERAIGVVLKRHCDVNFHAETDRKSYTLRLTGGFRRWIVGRNPQTRYSFEVIAEEDRTVDDDPIGSASPGVGLMA